jgi:hypothetical protein
VYQETVVYESSHRRLALLHESGQVTPTRISCRTIPITKVHKQAPKTLAYYNNPQQAWLVTRRFADALRRWSTLWGAAMGWWCYTCHAHATVAHMHMRACTASFRVSTCQQPRSKFSMHLT